MKKRLPLIALLAAGLLFLVSAVVPLALGAHAPNEYEEYSFSESKCQKNMFDRDVDSTMKCIGMLELLIEAYDWTPLPHQTQPPFIATTDDELRDTVCQEDLDSLSKDELLDCHYDVRIVRNRLFFSA